MSRQRINLWLSRVGWMALIWTASVLALAVVAFCIRLFMQVLGLHT